MWSQLGCHTQLLERERHREHSLHRIKLLRIKLRASSPRHMPRISPCNPRNQQRVLEKHDEICWKNQLLLKKMIDIGSKPTSVSMLSHVSERVSLNGRSRREEVARIRQDNRKLLHRLQRMNSSYSVKQWEEESGFYTNLRQKMSQNSGRVPRSADYTSAGFERMLSLKNLRGGRRQNQQLPHFSNAQIKLAQENLRKTD